MPATAYDFPQVYERVGMQLGHFGCIMLDVEPVPVTDILSVGEDWKGDTDWFYESENPLLRYVRGPVAEHGAHATLLYGLTPDDNAGVEQRDSVDELLAGLDLSSVTVDEVSYFPGQFGEPYACVVAKLRTSGDLGEANRRLRFLPHIDTFVEYKPHVTLAYVHEGQRDRAINRLHVALRGKTLKATGIDYGGPL